MKTHLRKLALAVTVLGAASSASATGLLNEASSAPALNKASSAYLAKDFKKMAVEIKKALEAEPNDPLVQESAFGLLKKAYELRGQAGVPADWHLPDEITNMKIAVHTIQTGIPEYTLNVYGNIITPGLIKELRVTRYPDQVILDKQAKVGDFDDVSIPEDHDGRFFYGTQKSHQPVPAGLYLLRVELTNGKIVDGWFLIDNSLNATATPDILAPATGETFHTGNPSFRWVNFQSPQYQPYEARSMWMGVSNNGDQKWMLRQDSPTLQEATLGVTPDGSGVKKLEDGRYVLVIKYHERKRFGDVLIGRDSDTTRPFAVRQ